MNDLKLKLAKAKTRLILEHPFIGTIALNMPFHIRDPEWFAEHGMPPTACVNGSEVNFCGPYIEDMDDDEVLFLVSHECFHPMLEHTTRRGEREGRKWNHAADYVINQLLTDEKIGKMPEGGLLDKRLYDAGEGITDKIYNLLPDNEDGDGPGGEGDQPGPLDTVLDGGNTPAEIEQQREEWKVKVAQAAQSAKMMGKLSAGMARLVQEVLEPKVLWSEVLQRFVVKVKADERTFARPNRRFQDMYLPSRTGEYLGPLVVAVDCSGSVGPDELAQFTAELTVIQEDHKPRTLHVIYFDSEVSHREEYTPDEPLDIKPHGGGGTAFSPIFRDIEEQGIEPVACVVLTDLYCSDFGDAPEYPVLWVSYGRDTAPWGEVVLF